MAEPPPVVHTLRGHPYVWECHMDGIRDDDLKALTDGKLLKRAVALKRQGLQAVADERTWEALALVGYVSALHYIACSREVGLSGKLYRLLDDLCEEAEALLWDLEYTPWYRDNEAHKRLFGQPLPRVR